MSLALVALPACAEDPSPAELPTLDKAKLFETAVSQSTADFESTQRHVPANTPTPTSTTTPVPTIDRTRPLMQTPTGELLCNRAAAGQPIDVTIPDGTLLAPGQGFSKTWRLVNVGNCTWTRLYAVTFYSGNRLNAFHTHYILQPVEPGEIIDITVDFEAPQQAGVYQSNWMLINAEGDLFGIGPHGDAPFWVKIEVVYSSTKTPEIEVTPTPQPNGHLTGQVRLSERDQFDLDTATLNPADPTKSDLSFQYGGDPLYILQAMNGARWKVFGKEPPSYNDCIDIELSEGDIGFEDLPDAAYVCYQTSQGKPGWFLIEGIDLGAITIRYLTWLTP